MAVAGAARLLLASFGEMERAAAAERALQTTRLLDSSLVQLAQANADYTAWDDALRFANGANPSFTADNFSQSSMGNLLIDLVLISDAEGRLLFSAYHDRRSSNLVTPAPQSLTAALTEVARAPERGKSLAPMQRMIRTDRGIAAFAVSEITSSDGAERSAATLMFARLLDGAELSRLSTASGAVLQLITLDSLGNPDALGLPEAIIEWAAARPPVAATNTALLGNDSVAGFAMLQSVDGLPAALLVSSDQRNIYALGKRTAWWLLATLFAFVAALCGVLWWLLHRLRQAADARELAANRLRNIASQLSETLLLVDPATLSIIDANDAATRLLGRSAHQLRGQPVLSIYPELTAEQITAATRGSGRRCVLTSRMIGARGETDVEVTITRLSEGNGALLCLVGHDVGHRKDAEVAARAHRRKLSHMAQHDSLTGLPNRLFLSTRLPRVLDKIARDGRQLGLIYMDVDHFKSINDTRGHSAGDELLRVVSKRLRNCCAPQDVVVRMGGDEFVIIASLLNDVAEIEELARRICGAVSAPIAVGGSTLTVTTSLGIARYPADGKDMESLLKHADIALYKAKEAGRNTYRYFTADSDLRISEDLALEQTLRHALDSNQLYLDYQPIMELGTNQIASFEALMRWQHPELGLIAPTRFVPAAEKIGLVDDLGIYAVKQVLELQAQWKRDGVFGVPIAVNIAAPQFIKGDFASKVIQLAGDAGVELSDLRFEITESMLLEDSSSVAAQLQLLRARGAQVLIDDFGTGYSALSHLNRLPADFIKIDRSFVEQLNGQHDSSDLVTSILDMASSMGLRTVAEGVETLEQMLWLRMHGCPYAQGFFFSKPLSASRSTAILRQFRAAPEASDTMVHRVLRSA